MTEQDVYEKIRASAEQITIPDSIAPEEIKKKVKKEKNSRHSLKRTSRIFGTAAAVAVICCGGAAYVHNQRLLEENNTSYSTAADEELEIQADAEEQTAAAEQTVAAAESKQDAGKLYVVAQDYGQVYDLLLQESAVYSGSGEMTEEYKYAASYDDGTLESSSADESATDNTGRNVYDISETLSQSKQNILESAAADSDTSGEETYAATNVQTEGVDESDIIKTDGKYLYIVKDDEVEIISVNQGKMKLVSELSITMNCATDQVLEMYVDGDILSVIVEREETSLQDSSYHEIEVTDDSGMIFLEGDSEEEEVTEDTSAITGVSESDVAYYFDGKTVTELLTYDISNREQPSLQGTITQDGYYQDSRKIGDIIYLFTNKNLTCPNLTREEALTKEEAGSWIPLVNGNAVAAEDIYLPEQGSFGLVLSSTNVKEPEQIVDNTLIVNDYVDIYVSQNTMYLYDSNYQNSRVITRIAKFSLTDGRINAVGAVSVPGEITDSFAINEYQGNLRVLTTDWTQRENENGLYLFDKDLNLTGKLEKIATGEQIYAARYLGDMAYFVTYRNTDPLFAVDLSDTTSPKILSELEITGFSEYLHFWNTDEESGETLLLGIGYETDPDTGAQKGLKLTMFDITNPADLKIAGTTVISNATYSPALYQYKAVLADPTENLIGFATLASGSVTGYCYKVYSWENGTFTEQMTASLSGQMNWIEKFRGIYVGDTFYVASPEKVISYDRTNGYQLIEELDLTDSR
jgi:uncharacterized secreted protein with C-terminal beta-propeller domain